MKRVRLTIAATGVLFLAAAIISMPGRSAVDATQKISAVNNGPSITQMNDPKFQINLLDQRVTALEQKLAAAERQLAHSAAHTHSYNAPHCNEFVSVLNLQDAASHPGGHAGMGVCFIRPPSSGFPPVQTSAPGK